MFNLIIGLDHLFVQTRVIEYQNHPTCLDAPSMLSKNIHKKVRRVVNIFCVYSDQ